MASQPLHLTGWLDHCALNGLGFGLHERMLAHLLVQRLRWRGAWPDDLAERLALLAPVLCRSADDQNRYREIVELWLGRPFGPVRRHADVSSGPNPKRPGWKPLTLRQAAWAGLVLSVAVLTVAAYFLSSEDRNPRPASTATPAASAPRSVPIVDGNAPVPAPSLPGNTDLPSVYAPQQNIPAAEPQPPPWLATLRTAAAVLILVSALFTAWRLWRWHRRRLFAEAGTLPEDSITREVLRDPKARPLGPRPRTLRSVTRLLRQRVVTDALLLDARATVRASVQNGGALALRFTPRTQLPEYLALVERNGERDHQSQYHEAMVHALQLRGVPVDLYFYRHDPGQGCWRLPPPQTGLDLRLPGPPIALQSLLARHPRHRLLVFGDASAAVQQPGGTPAPWTHWVKPVTQRAWFTPLPLSDWGATEQWVTSAQGPDFLLLPMEEAALQTVADWFAAGTTRFQPDPQAPSAYPPLLRDAPDAWAVRAVPPPPAVRTLLLAQLRSYLGDAGMPWLAACALFPLLAWPLTLALGRKLRAAAPGAVADPIEDEAVLALGIGALAALPWFRHGRLPDWLRHDLIGSLPPALEQTLRDELTSRLGKATAPRGEVVASVARQTLRQMLRRGEGPLADVLLLRFLQPELAPKLAQLLPEAVRRWLFPKGVVLLGLRPTVAWLAALPMALAVLFVPQFAQQWQPEAQLPLAALTPVLADPKLGAFALSPEGRSLLLMRAGANDAEPATATLASVAAPAASAPRVWTGELGISRPVAATGGGADRFVWLMDAGAAASRLQVVQGQMLPGRTLQARRTAQIPFPATTLAYAPGILSAFVGTQTGKVFGVREAFDAQSWLHLSHASSVVALAVRPDGSRGASLAADGRLLLWDAGADPNQADAQPVGVPTTGRALAFSPDGQRLAVGLADGGVQIVAAENGALLDRLGPEPAQRTAPVVALAFSADGSRLASGHTDGGLTVWSLDRQLRVLRAQAAAEVKHLHFSPDGATLWLLDAAGRLQHAGAAPAAQVVAVLGCDEAGATPLQQGRTRAVADALAAALQPGAAAGRVAVLGMPKAMWLAWGHGRDVPVGGDILSATDAAAQVLATRVQAALQNRSIEPGTPSSAVAAAGQPAASAWRLVPVPQGPPTVTVGTCDVTPPPPADAPTPLEPTDWPADPADAQRQAQLTKVLEGLWQPDRAQRPTATQTLLAQPDLVSDLLPLALARAHGLADGKDPGSPDNNLRITQVLRLAQSAPPVTLQRNATALYRLIERAKPLSATATTEADRLLAAMQAARNQVPVVQLVLSASAGATERAVASKLQADWRRRGLRVEPAPAADAAAQATGLRASGASDRALGRWLLRQANLAQAGRAAPATLAALPEGDTSSVALASRAADSFRLVLAPLSVVEASAASGAAPGPARPASVTAAAPRPEAAGDAKRTPEELDQIKALELKKLGDAQQTAGDLNGARRSFEQSLQIFQRLAAANPSSAAAQRELAGNLLTTGTVLVEMGELKAARQSIEESLQISQRLAAADPSSAATRRDVSVSLVRLGEVLVAAGDLKGARQNFEQSLQISQRLAAADPSSAATQRDVSVSLVRLGEVLVDAGDLKGARQNFEQSLQITQLLAAADPSSAAAQRDLWASLDRLGDVQEAAGELKGARQSFEQSLQISQRLAAADPSSLVAQRSLSVSLSKLGNLQAAAGDLEDARQSLEESLQIGRRLAAALPSSAARQRFVSEVLKNLGDVQMTAGDLRGARQSLEESLQMDRRRAAANPSSAAAQRDVAGSMQKLAALPNSSVQWADVAAAFRSLKDRGALTPEDSRSLTEAERRAAAQR